MRMRSSLLLCLLFTACARVVAPVGAAARDTPPPPDDGATGPSGVHEARRISDLTPSEATQWCQWWINQIEPNRPPGSGVQATGPDAQGFRDYTAGFVCGEVAAPDVSLADCVANLEARPCVATIGQLEACGSAILAHPGCDIDAAARTSRAIHEQPDCADTFVVPPMRAEVSHFRLRVE